MATKSGVSLNWGGLDKTLLKAARNLSDRRLLLETAGEMLVTSTKERFEDEEDPTGKKWTPSQRATPTEDSVAPSRRNAKGQLLKGSGKKIKGNPGGKTLTDTARLRDSIDYDSTADAVTVGSKWVSKDGSNVKYARIHQLGGKAGRGHSVNIEARPYLGINDENMEDIREAVADFIKDSFTGGGQ